MAIHFNLSESSLRRKLNQENATIATLIRDTKLEVALSMLQTDNYSIREVANYCGWESQSRFSEVFSERWGVLPSVVKASQTNKNITMPK